MEREWSGIAELQAKLARQLEARHAGLVASLSISMKGDTLILRGEVASEDCKSDAKRLLLGYEGVFKVRNELVVAGFLEAASDDLDNYFGWKGSPTEHELDRKSGNRDDLQQTRRSDLKPDFDKMAEAVEVVRHPVIETTGMMTPGGMIQVEVDLTMDASRSASPISLGRFPSDWQTIAVRVQLFATWAAEMIVDEANVMVMAGGTSRPARFRLVVADHYVAGTQAPVHVSFLHGTRVCGHLSRDLADAANAPEADNEAVGDGERTVAVVPDASGPSLSVSIACDDGGRQTWMWVALVPGGTEQGSEQINLTGGGKEFAEALLRKCPDLEATVFRRAIAGVGEHLWAAAPARFRSAYVDWRAKLGPSFPIQFVSDDPHVPWEMMKPDIEGIDHLFLTHPVARWPLTRAARRRHEFPGGAVLSFVPKYDLSRTLPSAEAEGEWICANLGATAMPATSTAFLDVLDGGHTTAVGIIHFAGHGTIDTGVADGGIELEDRAIGVGEVNQSSVVLGRRNGTLVVLNACETSAGSRLLGMNTGWGATIAAREFGGLVAPLWEVQDDVALAMIRNTLPPLIDRSSSLGEAVTAAREASGNHSSSAFAYLAHGDVMARFARS